MKNSEDALQCTGLGKPSGLRPQAEAEREGNPPHFPSFILSETEPAAPQGVCGKGVRLGAGWDRPAA